MLENCIQGQLPSSGTKVPRTTGILAEATTVRRRQNFLSPPVAAAAGENRTKACKNKPGDLSDSATGQTQVSGDRAAKRHRLCQAETVDRGKDEDIKEKGVEEERDMRSPLCPCNGPALATKLSALQLSKVSARQIPVSTHANQENVAPSTC